MAMAISTATGDRTATAGDQAYPICSGLRRIASRAGYADHHAGHHVDHAHFDHAHSGHHAGQPGHRDEHGTGNKNAGKAPYEHRGRLSPARVLSGKKAAAWNRPKLEAGLHIA